MQRNGGKEENMPQPILICNKAKFDYRTHAINEN